MHVGHAPVFQNLSATLSDYEAYKAELKLVDLTEPLGFDSIWQPEHHFTEYEMTPDVLQFLSYCAGRTSKVLLGSMAVILPWHDPMRVAEQSLLLDHLCDGRFVLGMGRGLGAIEFNGFRVDMSESRKIFNESAEAIVRGLESGVMEYDGEWYKQPARNLRPGPFKSFKGRTIGAGLSPDSAPFMARLGVGMMIFPLKSWDDVKKTLADYGVEWRRLRPDSPPPEPMQIAFTYTHKDPGYAREKIYEYVRNYYTSLVKHYDLAGDQIKKVKGYEFYSALAQANQDDLDATVQKFVDLAFSGTPEQVIAQIREAREQISNNAIICHYSFGGMPYDEAEASMRLFAAEVMPTVKQIKTAPFAEIRTDIDEPAMSG